MRSEPVILQGHFLLYELIVKYHDTINGEDLGNLTRQFYEAIWTESSHGRATIGEDRIKGASSQQGNSSRKRADPNQMMRGLELLAWFVENVGLMTGI
jgi:hypothetical protein